MTPDFYDDTVLARCSHSARLVYPALWQLSDRCGVFEWDVAKIRKYAFGYDNIGVDVVANLLNELLREGRIQRAFVDGREWGLVPKLAKHQHFHRDEQEKHRSILETASWHSAPCEHDASTVLTRCQHGANTVPAPGQHDASTPDIGYLISENGELRTDLLVPQAEASRKKKSIRSPEEQARAKLIREAFQAGYRERYGRELDRWGAPENAHVYHLLKSSSAEVLAAKAGAYFRWARHEVISAGHPFFNHRWSFSHCLSELTADAIAPTRRAEAAQVRERERLDSDLAAEADQLSRLNKLNAQGDPFEPHRQRLEQQEHRGVEQITSTRPREIATRDRAHDAGALSLEAQRPSGPGVVQGASPICDRIGGMVSAGAILRGPQNAKHQPSQIAADRAPGPGNVRSAEAADSGAAPALGPSSDPEHAMAALPQRLEP